MTNKTKQPSRLMQDNDGHWYLVPDVYAVSFESALSLTSPTYGAAMNKFVRYQVDGPSSVVILNWRER